MFVGDCVIATAFIDNILFYTTNDDHMGQSAAPFCDQDFLYRKKSIEQFFGGNDAIKTN